MTNILTGWYITGFGSCILACLGFIHFIAINVSNYSHINSEKRYSELKNIIFTELYSPNNINLSNYKKKLSIDSNNLQKNYQTNHNLNKPNYFSQKQFNINSIGATRRNSYHNLVQNNIN